MAFWNRKPEPYDRSRILAEAEKARGQGKAKKAVSHYEKVLAADPKDPHVNVRIAPLLFKLGRVEDAGKAYETAAATYDERGFADKAGAVLAQAVEHFPLDRSLWSRLADSAAARGHKADAVKALLQGARGLVRRQAHRDGAVELLEKALVHEPLHVEATIALAQALKAVGRKADGMQRLEALHQQVVGDARKRLRRAQFGLSPGLGTWWRWVRA